MKKITILLNLAASAIPGVAIVEQHKDDAEALGLGGKVMAIKVAVQHPEKLNAIETIKDLGL